MGDHQLARHVDELGFFTLFRVLKFLLQTASELRDTLERGHQLVGHTLRQQIEKVIVLLHSLQAHGLSAVVERGRYIVLPADCHFVVVKLQEPNVATFRLHHEFELPTDVLFAAPQDVVHG